VACSWGGVMLPQVITVCCGAQRGVMQPGAMQLWWWTRVGA